jgi:hypothetical protein
MSAVTVVDDYFAALDPSAAWRGHADALKGDVHGQLERAAAA